MISEGAISTQEAMAAPEVLYEGVVPVTVRASDREDRQADLTFHISVMWQQSHKQRVLTVCVSLSHCLCLPPSLFLPAHLSIHLFGGAPALTLALTPNELAHARAEREMVDEREGAGDEADGWFCE